MRILCVSDLHHSEDLAKSVFEVIKKEKIDVFVSAGDFVSDHFAKEVLDKMKVRSFVVHGNWDTNIKTDNKKVSVLMNEVEEYCGYYFLGIDDRFALDEEIFDLIKDKPLDKVIIISHSPPYGILDATWGGMNVGFPIYREFLENNEGVIHVCGHIHESAGYILYKKNIIINSAVIYTKKGYIIELPSREVREVSLE
ncbi:MAG: metallophosphoesterase [Candidatus Aenigmarchaeota archaeon]|nr:metallophosphoesterase [Candidatus Aenigmarchaeota archaeon]